MMIRKPNAIDITKALDTFLNNQEMKDTYLIKWLRNVRNPNFYSLVAIDKKQGIGLLYGIWNAEEKYILLDLFLSMPDSHSLLLNKLKKDLEPNCIELQTLDPGVFEKEGFKVAQAVFTMCWSKKEEPKEEEKGSEMINEHVQ